MAEIGMTRYLRPGDTVLIGQAAAEPPDLVEQFIAAAHAIGGLTAFCGYTLSDAWAGVSPGQPNIRAYVTPARCASSARRAWWTSSPATTTGSRT